MFPLFCLDYISTNSVSGNVIEFWTQGNSVSYVTTTFSPQRGSDGSTGSTGPQGPQGPPGPAGENIPPGTITMFGGINPPTGWLFCDGSSLIVLEYQSLFNAIGYTYGGATTTFNIPDTRGRTSIGSGTGSALTARTLGNKGGEETHVLTEGEMPSHTHSSNATGTTIGLIIANGQNTASNVDSSTVEPNIYAPPQALTINSTGSGNAHNVMQPFIVFNYLIKY
jgi:microcystin-dependent protein